MISYKIHLIRTGSTSESNGKRYVGQSDLPLCDKGRDTLEELHSKFAYPQVDMVFCSPLSRCVETAEILYPTLEAETVTGLMDLNMGAFEGKTFEQLRSSPEFSSWLANSFENTPPGGEETAAFNNRVVAALDHVLRRMMQQRCTTAPVVTHGGVIMTLLAAVGLPRLPLHQWAVTNGTGFTLVANAKLWMDERAMEIHGFIPNEPLLDDMEVYGI